MCQPRTYKKQILAKYRKDFVSARIDDAKIEGGRKKTYEDLLPYQKSAIFDFGYNEDEWMSWRPNYKEPGCEEWGPDNLPDPFNWEESRYYTDTELAA